MNEMSNNLKTSSQSNKGLWMAIIVCIVIIAGTFYGVLAYFAFALAIAAVVLLKQDDALTLMMMVMPFANIFKTAPEGQSLFTYLMLFYVLWYFIKSRMVHRKFMFALGGLVLFLILQMTVSMNTLRMIKFLVNILFIYLAVNSATSHNNKRIYLAYIIGFVITSLIAASDLLPNLIDYVGIKDQRLEDEQIFRFAGMYGDPNYYSVNIIISLCLIVILHHKKELSTIPAVCLSVFMIIFVARTASKSAFLMLILPLILLLYSRIKKKNFFILACVLAVSAALIFRLLAGEIEIFSNVLLRFDAATDTESLTTGRSYLWERYMNFLGENPQVLWFGKGFGADVLGTHAAHNTYLDLLYYLGIIGTALTTTVFVVLTRIKRDAIKLNLLNYSVWLCIGVMYFFLSELFYFDWAFHIVIAMLISKMDMNQIKEG